MDPSKRMARPATDYMAKGADPSGAGVHQARQQRQAEALYVNPGTRVPNNTLVARGIEQELIGDNSRVVSNLYGDWRAQGLPGTGVNYAPQPPTPGWAARMNPMPQGSNEVFDILLSSKIRASQQESPLPPAANPLIADPGLAAQVARRPDGGPMGLPLPPSPGSGREDLMSAVPIEQLGRPGDALFPRPEVQGPVRGKGKPASMPRPAVG